MDDDTTVLQADKSNEQTDTSSDSRFQLHRNSVGYEFTHFEKRQENEDDSLDEDRRERELPTMTHSEADTENKKGIHTHSGSQSERFFSDESHGERTDDSRQHRSREDSTIRHSHWLESTENTRIDGQDIGHGKESSDTRKNLRTHLMLRGVKTQ